MSKLFLVEVQSVHRVFYAIRVNDTVPPNLIDLVNDGIVSEFGQHWLGESVVGSQEVSEEQLIKKYRELYPGSIEPDVKVLEYVANLEKDDETEVVPEAED